MLEYIVGAVAVGAVLAFIFREKKPPPGPAPRPTTFGDAKYFDRQQCETQGLLSGQGIPLGYFPGSEGLVPLHYKGDRHLIAIAPTRTGKGTTAQVPTLIEHDASLFMIDPKGENAAIVAKWRRDALRHEVFIVNPFGVLGESFAQRGFPRAARFNPLAALNPRSETYNAEVAALCEALIIGESGNKDSHWTDSARDLVAARILWACTFGKPGERTLPAVRDFLTLDQAAFIDAIATMAACNDIPIRNKAMRFLKAREELDSIVSTAQTQTAFLDDPRLRESLCGNDFYFLNLKRKKISVFLVLPAKLIPAYARWFRLLVVSALDALMSTEEKGDKPVLLMLDEFASLGHLSSVENAMGLAAGFGVQLWPFVQDIHQLEDIYAKRWKSFLANAGVQMYFTPNDMDTAEFISKRAGNMTIVVSSSSKREISRGEAQHGFSGISTSVSEVGIPLIEPHKVFGLSSNEGIVFLAGCEDTLRYTRLNYMYNTRYARTWLPNPYFAFDESERQKYRVTGCLATPPKVEETSPPATTKTESPFAAGLMDKLKGMKEKAIIQLEVEKESLTLTKNELSAKKDMLLSKGQENLRKVRNSIKDFFT